MREKLGRNLTFFVTFLNPIAVNLTNVVSHPCKHGSTYHVLQHELVLSMDAANDLLPIVIVVVVVVVVSDVVNFSHFHLLLQNHRTNFNQTWHNTSLGEGDSSLFK